MTESATPWYVRIIVGIGAWITALVLIAFGASFLYALMEVDSRIALSVFGAAYFALGLWLLSNGPSGVFAQQLGISTGAAGGAMIAVGIGLETESIWAMFLVAILLTAIVVAVTNDLILQFLAAAFAIGCYTAALLEANTGYLLDLLALATPLGLALYLLPAERRLAPTAVALLLAFPAVTVWAGDIGIRLGQPQQEAVFARIVHIVLFLVMVYLHWRRAGGRASGEVLAFAVGAVLVCLVLPPGGSAAMLLLMLAFVIGSLPFAAIGVLLQGQFIFRYYYSLEMNLLDKSLLLMAVGAVLLALWWLLYRRERAGGAA